MTKKRHSFVYEKLSTHPDIELNLECEDEVFIPIVESPWLTDLPPQTGTLDKIDAECVSITQGTKGC